MSVYNFNFRLKGISFSPAKDNARQIYSSLVRQTPQGEPLPRIAVFLVPEPENRYDPRAVQVFANTQLFGRLSLGHVPARGFCPYCDPEMNEGGHPAYPSKGKPAVTHCPDCGQRLTQPMNAQLQPLLMHPGAVAEATAFFTGNEPGRENLGAVCYVKITIPDEGASVVQLPDEEKEAYAAVEEVLGNVESIF